MMATVLIADDYDDMRELMKFLLELHGYEAIEASNGYDAVEKTYKYHPDMIFMDLSMPVLNGLDATRAIRQLDGTSDIPIVAVTAYGDFYKDKALAAGCTDVITKPMRFDNIKSVIDSYLAAPPAKNYNGH